VSESHRERRVQEFLDRHAFAFFPDGGIAVDLQTGTFSFLNASAAATCELISRSRSWAEALVAATRQWDLSEEQANAALEAVQRALAEALRVPSPGEAFPYLQTEGGYALYDRGRRLLEIDRDGNHVRLASPREPPARLEHCLRLVSPKILAAHGWIVLHAAACQLQNRLLAFCGLSGAGKTTTTDLLAEAGAPKIADDLVLVSVKVDCAIAHTGAEARIYGWCAQAAEALMAKPSKPLPCEALLDVVRGGERRLDGLVFLDRLNRGGVAFETQPLSAAAAMERILSAVFLGGVDRPRVREFLGRCRDLSLVVPSELARPPGDVRALAAALRDYTTKTAS
jgi:hypothetical protein